MTMQYKRIPVGHLASGQEISIPSYEFSGRGFAKSVYIQSNLHGTETQGNAVIAELIEYFQENPPLGKIQLIPFVNPLGMSQKWGNQTYGRYHPIDGENYNRGYQDFSSQIDYDAFKKCTLGRPSDEIRLKFKELLQMQCRSKFEEFETYGASYNQKLCLIIQEQAHKADIILDLHCDTESLEHLYSASYAIEAAKDLGFPVIYEIPPSFAGALDEASFMPWIKLEEEMTFPNPVLAYTLELGDEESWNSDLASRQAKRILHFLYKRGVLKNPPEITNIAETHIAPLKNLKKYRAPCGGNLEFFRTPGEIVQEGDIIGKIYTFEEAGLSSHPLLAQKTGILTARVKTSSCPEGMLIFQILE